MTAAAPGLEDVAGARTLVDDRPFAALTIPEQRARIRKTSITVICVKCRAGCCAPTRQRDANTAPSTWLAQWRQAADRHARTCDTEAVALMRVSPTDGAGEVVGVFRYEPGLSR